MVCRLPLLPSWIPFTILLAIYMSLVFGEIPGDKDFNNGEAAEDSNSNSTKNYTLTGIPQLDYVHDPNLPRELNGYNLSSYPFLNRVPTTNYSCEGLKDGFYASVEFKCQLYHQCLFGNRYDFLCANYTAFDQRTFICHFVSEVDCPNSASFFHRNDALYIAPTTTSAPRPSRGRQRVIPLLKPERFNVDAPKTSSPLKNQESDYAGEPSKAGDEDLDAQDYEDEDVDRRAIRKKKRRRRPAASRRRRPRPRRPIRRRRPPVYYDDYYDEEEYDDYSDDYQDDYEDERVAKPKAKNKGRIKNSNPVKKEAIQSSSSISSSTSAPPPANDNNPSAPTASSTTAASQNNSTPIPLEEIYSQSRPPPKIRPPVPKHVMSKYTRNNAYEIMHGRSSSSGTVPQTATTSSTSTTAAASQPPQQSLKTDNTEYVEYDYEPSSTFKTNRQLHTRPTFKPTSAAPARTTTTTTTSTTTTTTTTTTPKPSEAPEYEYYEYEDDAPQPPQPSPPSPTTSTTTTTTTPKPSQLAQHRRLRNRKPEITQEVVYSTSNSPVAISHDTSVSVSQGAKTSNMNDRFLRRSKPSVNTYTNDNQGISESTVAFSSTTPELPSSTTLNSRQQQQPQQNFNARFPSYEVTNSKPSDIQTVRPSRFWQRQQKIVTSTTTTLPPQPEYVEYYEDPVPVRYGQKSASTYTQQYQPQPESTEIPQRMVNYNSSPRYPQTPSNMRPLDQSNFVTPYATREPVNQMRPTAPEFISLLQDDDSSYYSVDPHNPRRFHNTPVRQYSAAQETFPSYAPPPPTFGQYLKRIHQRHVAPQSYPWY